MRITTTSEYDAKEHYRASREVTRRTGLRWLPWIMGVVLAALLLFGWLGRGDASFVDQLAASAPWILLIICWFALIPVSQWWRAKKLPTRDASVRGAMERSIDEEGYHFRGNGVNLDVPWHALKRVVETELSFLFFYNKQCAYYLAKRSLRPRENEDVRRLIRDNVDAKNTILTE